MKICAIKTEKILPGKITLTQFIDKYIKELKENSIIAISSKVISYIENRIEEKPTNIDKLIFREADYIAKKKNKYNRKVTIKYNAFLSNGGIDPGVGSFVLLPKDPQKTAKEIYGILSKKFKKNKFGVIITDSRSLPLRMGSMGVAIGFWGFTPLKNYENKKDVFGEKIGHCQVNVVDSLASIAVLAIGEGGEQTPICVIDDIDSIKFSSSKPTKKDLDEFYLSLEDDIFHQFYKDFK